MKSLQRSAALSGSDAGTANFASEFFATLSPRRQSSAAESLLRTCSGVPPSETSFSRTRRFLSDEIPDASSSSPRNALYSELPFAAESSETAKFSISAQYFLSKLFA